MSATRPYRNIAGDRLSQNLHHPRGHDLNIVTATQDDAIALWQIWSPEGVSEGEREAFASALYTADEAGNLKTLLGKRSTTLALAIHHLHHCLSPASVPEIRRGMALSVSQDGSPYALPEELVLAKYNWLTLQMRQLQRLSMESLLSWCEGRILADRVKDTALMAERFSKSWDGSEQGFEDLEDVAAMIALLDQQADSAESFIEAIREGRLSNPFDLIATIQQLFKANDSSYAHFAFAGLLLCIAYAGAAVEEAHMLRLGGASRVSLESLRRRILALGAVSPREAFQYVIEAMIISQHFSTAVSRFDGQNQRLRLTIEETGLEALVGKPWEPTVTEDRLATALSLAAQSGLVSRTEEGNYTAV